MNEQPAPAEKVQGIALPIDNLNCVGDGLLMVKQMLTDTPGVIWVYVNPVTEMAYVRYNSASRNAEQLTAVLKRAGFGPPS